MQILRRKEQTERLHEAIINQYRKNKKQKYKQVAKAVGCSEVLVQRVLRKESKLDKEKRNAEIIKLRKEGLSHEKIAKKVGCNRQTVGTVLQKADGYVKGLTFRKGGAYVRKEKGTKK